jgi:hypothetical protein
MLRHRWRDIIFIAELNDVTQMTTDTFEPHCTSQHSKPVGNGDRESELRYGKSCGSLLAWGVDGYRWVADKSVDKILRDYELKHRSSPPELDENDLRQRFQGEDERLES